MASLCRKIRNLSKTGYMVFERYTSSAVSRVSSCVVRWLGPEASPCVSCGIFGGRQGDRVRFCFQALHQLLHVFLTGGDSSLTVPVKADRLSQRDQMFASVLARQAFGLKASEKSSIMK